ncbi:MAG: flotillin family protein [Candidatus Portnoybacteria bacterium]|nr:flotillin family protein [Candidatus Portnoybacteria bacterium]
MISLLGALFVPLMVVLGVVSFIVMLRLASKNYIKVPPNKVAIFYGRKHQTEGREVGFRVVSGGAKLKLPVVEDLAWLDLNMFSIDLMIKNAPNKDGVLVSLKGVANVKILSDQTSLIAAAERFLGMRPDEIHTIAHKNLEGHLRAIVGRLSVEQIVQDRSAFNQAVLSEAGEDLKKMGLAVDVLTIQEVEDEHGYITSLGKKRTAEVMRDAAVGTAEAERDSTINSTAAQREAARKKNENEALIAETEKERDVKKAKYTAEVAQEQATAAQAGPLATARAQKEVTEAQIEVLKAKTKKEAEVALAEAEKEENHLLATVVKPAEAQRQAAIAKADGDREAAIKRAEAEKQTLRLEGEGRAEAIRAEGTAEAAAVLARLLAEAEGLTKKAEAVKQLSSAGQLLIVLEKLETILPNSLEKLAPVMGEIAKPLGNVDRIELINFGGNGNGGTVVEEFANVVPGVIKKLVEGLMAVGMNPGGLVQALQGPAARGNGTDTPTAAATEHAG